MLDTLHKTKGGENECSSSGEHKWKFHGNLPVGFLVFWPFWYFCLDATARKKGHAVIKRISIRRPSLSTLNFTEIWTAKILCGCVDFTYSGPDGSRAEESVVMLYKRWCSHECSHIEVFFFFFLFSSAVSPVVVLDMRSSYRAGWLRLWVKIGPGRQKLMEKRGQTHKTAKPLPKLSTVYKHNNICIHFIRIRNHAYCCNLNLTHWEIGCISLL